ncbi:MAG: phosphoribosyltransferase family protein [Bacteroidota bacterium]|nr:phosphoribosyltransferase family protein [Bacteroidota bacterium]
MLIRILNDLFNLFYPKVCNGCNQTLKKHERILCAKCIHEIAYTNHHLSVDNQLYRRMRGRVPVERMMSLLYFEHGGIVQQMIHNLKYRGHQEIGTFLADWFSDTIAAYYPDVDCIIPMPLHKRRKYERGYNQISTFAHRLAILLQIPVEENVLYRKVYSKSQTKKTLLLRTKMQREMYVVQNELLLEGKHVLLIDDVITTGATIEQSIMALKKIKNIKISVISMAVAVE